MEIKESISYDLLFRDYNFESTETVLPLVRQCLTKSKDETEVERALEIALCFCLKNFSPNDLEEELFKIACPTAKDFVVEKLEYLEKNPEACFKYLAVVLKVVIHFQGVYDYLSDIEKLTFIEVKSLLKATSEILYSCYSHCKISEVAYGTHFNAASECLSNFFKNCCSLQEQLLDFLSEKSECDVENDRELVLLDDVLTYLSKCAVVLIHLEVKTMAKVWKTFVFLLQKYLSFLKNNHNIGETISQLCASITSNIKTALDKDSNEDIPKVIKLSCFLLKLIIKFCEAFKGCLNGCQQNLLSLALMLCRCDTHLVDKSKQNVSSEVVNQLTIGIDPLMAQLLADEELIKNCNVLSKDSKNSVEFAILCCCILSKLKDSDLATRSLWLNSNENILQWIFICASSSEFITCCDIRLPSVSVNGTQKKYTDLYEYVLVTASAFSMTASANEYRLVEKSLVDSVLQTQPIRALLAIDMWCVLARFADSELCFSQIVSLGKVFQEFTPSTSRPEKWYLISLIRRLFPLLAERHRKAFLEAFPPSLRFAVWSGRAVNNLGPEEVCDVPRSILAEIDPLTEPLGIDPSVVETGRKSVTYERLGKKIAKLWKFDCEVLSSTRHRVRFLRVCCVLTACAVAEIPSEHLSLVLSQMKRLLEIGQPTAVKLYFTSFLASLSPVRLPPDRHRKNTLASLAHAFRALLSSPEPLLKLRALHAFSAFSHATPHPEVVSLTVHQSPDLKLEVADYLRGKPSERADWGDCFRGLYRLRFQHVCESPEEEEEKEGTTTSSKRMKMWSPDVQQTVARWKEDARKLTEHFRTLSDSQKREIKNVCNSFLSLP